MQRVVQKASLQSANGGASGDLQYWLTQTVAARLAAVEVLRQQIRLQDAERRLQTVCRITQLKGLTTHGSLASCRAHRSGGCSEIMG